MPKTTLATNNDYELAHDLDAKTVPQANTSPLFYNSFVGTDPLKTTAALNNTFAP